MCSFVVLHNLVFVTVLAGKSVLISFYDLRKHEEKKEGITVIFLIKFFMY